MQFPESWLRTFVDPQLTTDELSHALTMAGLEVESLSKAAPPTSKIVVGRVLEVVKHPDADKLNVCQVDAGTGATLNIVCGAPNVAPGIKVPVALVGAELPPAEEGGKPFAIKLSKLRGVESQGMLCSARELKLSEDHSGLLILPEDTPVGQDIRDTLNLDDTIFEIKLTPNKADCLSVFGIARETAAITGAPLTPVDIRPVRVELDETLPVRITAPDLCGRFSGRVIRGVNAHAKTPQWMVERLERSGQRSVSALVDISNYVMFELGRPSHVFDLDKIHGGIEVRWGKRGESLKLLNGNTVELDETVGVIADDRQVESLAGIMGGDSTAVTLDTTNIYLEAAFWWPDSIRGRARRYNFSTDAGHRFERGVDPSRTVEVIEHITRLIQQICGGEAGPIDDQTLKLPEAKPVTLRVARAARVIGMPLTQAQCTDVLRRLGFALKEGEGTITVTPPPHRFDLTLEEDLIEEVARLVGYNNLPSTPPLAPITARVRSESRRGRFALRRRVADLGYQETINFSFVEAHWEAELAGNADPIKLLNPIASQMSVMRSSLLGSLLQVLKFNIDRKAARVRVFEAGRVFMRDDKVQTTEGSVKGIRQPMRLAGLAWGDSEDARWDGKAHRADFFEVKGDVEALLAPRVATFEPVSHPALHPGRAARVLLDGREIGVLGELHPRWRQSWDLPSAPVLFELDLDAVEDRVVPAGQAVPKHQAVERDIAVVVAESVTHAALMKAIHSAPTQGLLQQAVLFDIYRPQPGAAGGALAQGEKSMAVRLSFQGASATLTDEQVEPAVRAVIESLAQQLGARMR